MVRRERIFSEATGKFVSDDAEKRLREEESKTGSLRSGFFKADDPLSDITPEERKKQLDTFKAEQQEKKDVEVQSKVPDATNQIIDTTKEMVADTEEFIKEEEKLKEELTKGTEEATIEAQKIAEEKAKGQKKLLEDQEKKVIETKAEADRIALEEKEKQLKEFEAQKAFANSKNEAQAAQAALRAEREIRDQKVQNRTDQLKFKLYLNRTGLANTGAGAYQAVQLANNGARTIAELQEDSLLLQQQFRTQADKIELDYTTAINGVTTEYNQSKSERDATFDSTISKINAQAFTTDIERREAINKAKVDYLDSIRAIQTSFANNVTKFNNDLLAQKAEIEAQKQILKAEGIEELNQRVIDGTFFNATDLEKAEIANKMGITLPELRARVQTELNGAIRALYDATLGTEYVIGTGTMNGMASEVIDLMSNSSYDLQRALNEIVLPTIKDTPEYKDAIEAQQAEAALSVEEREAEIELIRAKAAKERAVAISELTPKSSKVDTALQEVEAIKQVLSVGNSVPATTIANVLEKLPIEKQLEVNQQLEEARAEGKAGLAGYSEENKTKMINILKGAEGGGKEVFEEFSLLLNNAAPFFTALPEEEFKDELESLGILLDTTDLAEGDIYYEDGEVRLSKPGFDEVIVQLK